MLMAEQEPYALMVQPDDMLINPRELDKHFGTMVCFHRRYDLGDKHDYLDKDDFLRELYLSTVGNDERGTRRYERMLDTVGYRKDIPLGSPAHERATDNALLSVISEKYIVLPLYLLDHSGLAMNTTGFSCPWDSGQIGWIYVSKADALAEFDGKRLTTDIRSKAVELMRSEVEVYDSYLRGECYGFELYKNGELADSCWGFIGSLDEAVKNMAEYLPQECKGMIERLEEQNHPASIIKTLLRHAKIQVEQAQKSHERPPRQRGLDPTL